MHEEVSCWDSVFGLRREGQQFNPNPDYFLTSEKVFDYYYLCPPSSILNGYQDHEQLINIECLRTLRKWEHHL